MKTRITCTTRKHNEKYFRPKTIVSECDCGHYGIIEVPETKIIPFNLVVSCSLCSRQSKYKVNYFDMLSGKSNVLNPITFSLPV